jgi:hypothetical protein
VTLARDVSITLPTECKTAFDRPRSARVVRKPRAVYLDRTHSAWLAVSEAAYGSSMSARATSRARVSSRRSEYGAHVLLADGTSYQPRPALIELFPSFKAAGKGDSTGDDNGFHNLAHLNAADKDKCDDLPPRPCSRLRRCARLGEVVVVRAVRLGALSRRSD